MRHDVTITWQWVSRYDFYVTCPISGKQDSTDPILVSILPIFEAEELENNTIIYL